MYLIKLCQICSSLRQSTLGNMQSMDELSRQMLRYPWNYRWLCALFCFYRITYRWFCALLVLYRWIYRWFCALSVLCRSNHWMMSGYTRSQQMKCDINLSSKSYDLIAPQAGIHLRSHQTLIKIEVKCGGTFIQSSYTTARSLVENEGVPKQLRTYEVIKSNSNICEPLCQLWSANNTLAQ